MRREEFEAVYGRLEGAERALLVSKRAEYAGGEDVLRNFKVTATALGRGATPEGVCLVLLMTHVQAVSEAVMGDKSATLDSARPGGETLAERISDARNYLVLLAALVEERNRPPGLTPWASGTTTVVPCSDYVLTNPLALKKKEPGAPDGR